MIGEKKEGRVLPYLDLGFGRASADSIKIGSDPEGRIQVEGSEFRKC